MQVSNPVITILLIQLLLLLKGPELCISQQASCVQGSLITLYNWLRCCTDFPEVSSIFAIFRHYAEVKPRLDGSFTRNCSSAADDCSLCAIYTEYGLFVSNMTALPHHTLTKPVSSTDRLAGNRLDKFWVWNSCDTAAVVKNASHYAWQTTLPPATSS